MVTLLLKRDGPAAERLKPGFDQFYTNFGKSTVSSGRQSISAPSAPWTEVNVPHS